MTLSGAILGHEGGGNVHFQAKVNMNPVFTCHREITSVLKEREETPAARPRLYAGQLCHW